MGRRVGWAKAPNSRARDCPPAPGCWTSCLMEYKLKLQNSVNGFDVPLAVCVLGFGGHSVHISFTDE